MKKRKLYKGEECAPRKERAIAYFMIQISKTKRTDVIIHDATATKGVRSIVFTFGKSTKYIYRVWKVPGTRSLSGARNLISMAKVKRILGKERTQLKRKLKVLLSSGKCVKKYLRCSESYDLYLEVKSTLPALL